jgi:hypothetical protein
MGKEIGERSYLATTRSKIDSFQSGLTYLYVWARAIRYLGHHSKDRRDNSFLTGGCRFNPVRRNPGIQRNDRQRNCDDGQYGFGVEVIQHWWPPLRKNNGSRITTPQQ